MTYSKEKERRRISDYSVISRQPLIESFPRGDRVLFIERDTASWIILEAHELQLFGNLSRPMTMESLLRRSRELSFKGKEAEEFISRLYFKGIIEVDGKSYYNADTLFRHEMTYPGFLCLHPTDRCNFACHYCMAGAECRGENMPLSLGKKIVERLITEFPQKSLCIDFHGGEPLTVFDNVVAIMEEAQKLGALNKKNVDFKIQTNGSLLSRERYEILKKFKVGIGFSLDGPEEIHNRHRVFSDGSGTFRKVWENYRLGKEMGFSPGTLAVVDCPENYVDVFNFFVSEGISSFRINFSSCIGRAKEKLEFSVVRAEEFAREYLKMVDAAFALAKEKGTRLAIQDLNNQIRNIVSNKRPFMCDRSPCGVGRSILGFGTRGGIFACEEGAGTGDFKIGDIYDSTPLTKMIDENSVLQGLYMSSVEHIPKCRKCTFKRLCGGGCLHKTYAAFGTTTRESPMCRFFQRVYHELIWKVHDNPEMAELLGGK